MVTLNRTMPIARKTYTCEWCNFKIQKGEKHHSEVFIYEEGDKPTQWRSHVKCIDIAGHQNMWDECDEGLSADDFREHIINEYMDLQIKIDLEHYNSKDYVIPQFKEQLEFVIYHHLKTTQ